MNKMPQSLEAFLGPDVEEKWFIRNLEGPHTKLNGITSQHTRVRPGHSFHNNAEGKDVNVLMPCLGFV
jgi:hypothetical protein